MKKKRILITGAGAPGGPGIIKALERDAFEIFTADRDSIASGRFLNHPFLKVPDADDENFIACVLDYCLSNKIEIVLPLVTRELVKFSKAKNMFLEKNIRTIVSPYESLAIANDKGKIYQYLRDKGITVPQFEIVSSIDSLVGAATKLGYPNFPVCIKPPISNGSRGVRILQEEIADYDLLFNHKPDNLYTSLHRLCEILKGQEFPKLIVAEYLPGREITVDTIVYHGVPKIILPRVREQIRGGISIRGTFIKQDAVIAYCDQILRSLDLHGPIGLQVKENREGQFQLLEINPRIQGTSVAAIGAGINLPAMAIKQEFEEVDFDSSKIKWGTSFVRYYEELFY